MTMMLSVSSHNRGSGSELVRRYGRRDASRKPGRYGTTATERLLLLGTIALLPLQSYLPKIMGLSVLFVLFGVLGAYLAVWRPRVLAIVLQHPVFVAGYVFVVVGLFMETVHESYVYREVIRIGFMIVGAVFIASLCRDRKALLSGTYGIVVASLWLSVALFLTVYGVLSSTAAADFAETERLRNEAFGGDFLKNDLNYMSFFAGQGAIVALTLALTATSGFRRYRLLAICGFCSVAAFLPLSRGGIAILVLSCACVVYSHGILRSRVIQMAVLLVVMLLVFVPEAAFKRFTLSADTQSHGKLEGRVRVFSAIIEHFPEYALMGVGSSDFYGGWGQHTGFAKNDGFGVSGAHNIFAQVTVLWGISGLLALLAVVWLTYRYFPKRCGADPLRLCLLGIAITVFLELLVTHVFAGKEFSIGLGLIVGACIWIWPRKMSHSKSMPSRLAYDTYNRCTPPMWRRVRTFNKSNGSMKSRVRSGLP